VYSSWKGSSGDAATSSALDPDLRCGAMVVAQSMEEMWRVFLYLSIIYIFGNMELSGKFLEIPILIGERKEIKIIHHYHYEKN
jgi:hypothetical protein